MFDALIKLMIENAPSVAVLIYLVYRQEKRLAELEKEIVVAYRLWRDDLLEK